MGGKMSRSKGMRGEYRVRDEYRALGYQAERVPLSGASAAMKGDVVVTTANNEKTYIEVKVRAGTVFKDVYEMTDRLLDDNDAIGVTNGVECIALSYSPVKAFYVTNFYNITEKDVKALRKITKIKEWVKGADLLAIKNDRKPFLYIRYL